MPLADWFQPPRQALAIVLAVALASVAVLAALSWKLVRQDRDLEALRRDLELEQAADALEAAMQQGLARLDAVVGAPAPGGELPPGVVSVRIAADSLVATPPRSLAYVPGPAPKQAPVPPALADAERFEFTTGDLSRAAAIYARLAGGEDEAVRALALMRLARVDRRRSATKQALGTYAELSLLDSTQVEELPASLVARLGRIGVFEETGQQEMVAREGRELLDDLNANRWPLTKAQYDAYMTLARRVVPAGPAADPAAGLRAEAAAWLWEQRNRDAPLTRRLLALPSGTALVVWRATPSSLDAVVAGSGYISSLAGPADPGIVWAVSNLEGHPVIGAVPAASPFAVRTATTSHLPWTLHVFPAVGRPLPSSPRGSLLVTVLGLVAVVLSAGWYSIFRSLSREREVARLQSDFVAAVSHEFRSPLTALTHAADLLVNDRLPSDAYRRPIYEGLARDTSRLQTLVEDLLAFSRLEAGGMAFRFDVADLGALVGSTVAEVRERVTDRGYVITMSCEPGPLKMSVDAEAMQRVLRNLLDNAVKYSPNARKIDVSLARDEHHVTIAVRDRGLGIPAAEQRAIFDRFVRGSESLALRIPGTGIGLAMVRQIVQAHGGEILLESAPGAGSVFTIQLPATRLATPSTEAARPAQAEGARS
jgi:signal transduction histidine kinase